MPREEKEMTMSRGVSNPTFKTPDTEARREETCRTKMEPDRINPEELQVEADREGEGDGGDVAEEDLEVAAPTACAHRVERRHRTNSVSPARP